MLLRSANHVKDLTVLASDGEIGTIQDLYFDDEHWTTRYLIVSTGKWLKRRDVLVSPIFTGKADWENKQLHLSLTRQQVEDSPLIDTQKPVSRQQEADYQHSFGTPYYWGGSYAWGIGPFPTDLMAAAIPVGGYPLIAAHEAGDSHLRSTDAVLGYHVGAIDGEIGHVEDFLIDQQSWTIRYLSIATRNWWPGKKVLLSPEWVTKVSWEESEVQVALSRETIQSAPEYIELQSVTREYESQLHEHYDRSPYWSATTP